MLCPNCNGKIINKSCYGRVGSYCGKSGYIIPEYIAMPTCENCNMQWETKELSEKLDRIFEFQRIDKSIQEYLKGLLKQIDLGWNLM